MDIRGVGRIAAAADGCTGAAGGCDVAVSDTDNGLEGVRITCRRTEDVSFTAAADGCAGAADGLYRALCYRDVGVALRAVAGADACARGISGSSGGLQSAHRRVADGDVSFALGVTTAADAGTAVGKSTFDTLFGIRIVDVDGRLAGGGFARTDGCAAAATCGHERISGDLDVGRAGRLFAAADACAAIAVAGGSVDLAAGDVDVGRAGRVFAAADACAAGAAGGLGDGAAGDVDLGSEGGFCARADARAAAVAAAALGRPDGAARNFHNLIAADAGAAFATVAGAVAAGSLLYLAAGDGEEVAAVNA